MINLYNESYEAFFRVNYFSVMRVVYFVYSSVFVNHANRI